MKDSTIVLLGVVSAVIAAIVVEWINRALNAPTATANDVAWSRTISGGYCALPNLNLAPESPASAYQTGSPVTNYRRYSTYGVLQVPNE